MKSLFSVVCLTVLVGMATSCCFPNQGSFDFTLRLTTALYYMRDEHTVRFLPFRQSMNGSGAFDFPKQKFYLSIPDYDAKVFIDLSTNQQMLTMETTFKKKARPWYPIAYPSWFDLRENCSATPLNGTFGMPWQCILDNDRIFVEGSENYTLNIPPLADGPITLKNGSCFPAGVDVKYHNSAIQSLGDIVVLSASRAHIELTNIVESIVDESVFEAPCEADQPYGKAIQIPTPDELVRMMREALEAETAEFNPYKADDGGRRQW